MLSATLFTITFLLFSGKAYGSCEAACEKISRALPDLYHTGFGAANPLWSTFQAKVQPLCGIEPEQSTHVAEILATLRKYECHFAILGGGTSPFKRASNADQGVTIDMRRMNHITFTNGTSLELKVGAGSVWADVYHALDGLNMSATGTRNSLTGVVGSILGGGISFFSEYHGWACDTVLEFEVVLADSRIVKASPSSHFDLFWALKGGGNNFGIVTNVVIEVFRDPPEWYTFQLFNIDDMATVFNRLEKHTLAMPANVYQIAVTLQWHVPTQSFTISERMVASKLPDLPESVPRRDRDGKWGESPVLQTNSYQRSILAMAQKMDGMNPPGFYNFFGSITVRSNTEMSLAIAEVFKDEVELIKGVPDLQVYIVYNPLTHSALSHMKRRGGNALGLTEEDGPLTVVNINLHWSGEENEDQMRRFMRNLITRFREHAIAMGMHHPYIFQNHAFEEQDVFAGSGEQKLARLKRVRQTVDPDGIFQKLQPGFFKLEPKLPEVNLEKLEL